MAEPGASGFAACGRMRPRRAMPSWMRRRRLTRAIRELAAGYRALRAALSRLNVLGGCCGTDYRHVEAIANAWGAV